MFCDDYVHRVGRTGRMGREGVAYTFVTPEEGSELTKIEMRINRMLTRHEVAGFEHRTKPAAAPAASTPASGAAAGASEPAPEPPKKAPLYGRDGRPVKRFRRAL
jgi:ATP-dependent RNA helicase DeaD